MPIIVSRVQDGLCRAFPRTDCVILDDVMSLPRGAYNTSRKQYHSSFILSKISDYSKNVDARVDRVLGIVDVDLYVPRLNFVFGEAHCPGRVAVISLFRLRPEFYGEPSSNRLFLERALKEAVHEVGHTLGLGHCGNSACVMFFSNSIFDTDNKGWVFCESCHRIVVESMTRRP